MDGGGKVEVLFLAVARVGGRPNVGHQSCAMIAVGGAGHTYSDRHADTKKKQKIRCSTPHPPSSVNP